MAFSCALSRLGLSTTMTVLFSPAMSVSHFLESVGGGCNDVESSSTDLDFRVCHGPAAARLASRQERARRPLRGDGGEQVIERTRRSAGPTNARAPARGERLIQRRQCELVVRR